MRRIVPLLLTLIAVCAVATADASGQAPATDAARLAQFLPIARAAWPGSPCAGREAVHLSGDAALRAEAPAIAGPGEALNGMAAPETCEVWLASSMSPRTFCSVLVHEFGHLGGLQHTTTPGDVMNGAGDIDYAPCDRATAPPAGELLEDELRSVLPAPRTAWRIRCGAKHGSERRCVARRGKRIRRYDVTQTRSSVTVSRDD
jgi:Matrixin